jgi:hypothetical protein
MATPPVFPAAICRISLLAFVLAGLGGCESDRSARRGSPEKALAAAIETPTPEMAVNAAFFAGQIEVEVLLNRTGFAKRDNATDAGNTGSGGGAGGGGSAGGRRRGGGGGRGGGGQTAAPSSSAASSDPDGPRPVIHESNEAPVRLHLRLTNHGTTAADLEVPDFDSELGNFVVQPPKINVQPGQSVETDPMTSRLGLRSAEIPLTVTLRRGGQTEKQVLKLRVIEPPPAAIPAAASGVPAAVTPPVTPMP